MDSDGWQPNGPNVWGVKEALAQALVDGSGVLVGRSHPHLAWPLRVARQRGELVTVLRGIYTTPVRAADFAVRVLALMVADPDAILLERSAAVVLGWRDPDPGEEVVAASRRIQSAPRGYRLTRRRIHPDDLHTVIDGSAPATPGTPALAVRCSSAALTAVDLARGGDGAPLDDALRRRIPLADLWAALLRHPTRGSREVRALLHESRDEPWSPAERAGHRALRSRGLGGWAANLTVERTPGRVAQLDVAFAALRLGVEIDGYAHHGSRAAFEADRARDVDLNLRGWHVVRVAAAWVLHHPGEFAAFIETVVRQRADLLGTRLPRRRRSRATPHPRPTPRPPRARSAPGTTEH